MVPKADEPLFVKDYEGPEAKYFQAVKCPLSFALLSPQNKALHVPVMCKDYIQDAFWSERMKKHLDVYGFTWDPGRLDISEKNFRMLLKYETEGQAEGARVTRSLLNLWEKRLDYWTADLRSTTDNSAKVLTFAKDWTDQPIRLSLMTLLLRIGTTYKTGESWPDYVKALLGERNQQLLNPNDALMVTAARGKIEAIWNEKKFPAQTYEQFTTFNSIHGASGIVRYQSN